MFKYPLSLYQRRFAYLPIWLSNGEVVWLNFYYKRIKQVHGHMHVVRCISEDKYLERVARQIIDSKIKSNSGR